MQPHRPTSLKHAVKAVFAGDVRCWVTLGCFLVKCLVKALRLFRCVDFFLVNKDFQETGQQNQGAWEAKTTHRHHYQPCLLYMPSERTEQLQTHLN